MITQTCVICLTEKELTEVNFFRSAIKKSGFESKCKDCRKKLAIEYRERNREILNKKQRERNQITYDPEKKNQYYVKNREKILTKKKTYITSHQEQIKIRTDKWREANQDILKKKRQEAKQKLKEQLFHILGDHCQLCGETNQSILTIDHLNNDGSEERKKYGLVGWKKRIINGQSDPSRYRVLCHNCNLSVYRQNPVHQLSNHKINGSKICRKCGIEKDLGQFSSQLSHDKHFCLNCRRNRSKELVKKCYESYGNQCQICGETDFYKLCIDHLNNDGSINRITHKSGIDICSKIIREELDHDQFQLLCWNCNIKKYHGTPKFNFSDLTVLDLSSHQVKPFLNEFHYAQFGREATKIYGVYLNNVLIATAKFCSIVRKEVATSMGFEYDKVLELDRFCIHPAYQKKNFASWFMSKVIKLVQKDFSQIMRLVSFADLEQGHTGTIYKASNWTQVGLTTPSYHYEDVEGNKINKKTLYNKARSRGLKEREYAESLNVKKIHTKKKVKFIYNLV